MLIQTEETPNPDTLKFLPGREVAPFEPEEFKTAEEAETNPLAHHLFELDGVKGVFYGPDFIAVSKQSDKEWRSLKTPIMGKIMDHCLAGFPFTENKGKAGEDDVPEGGEFDSELTKQIRELLDTRVRPAVAMDGGDITFERFDKGIVYLKMRGACAGCPSATMTLKSGIENMLRHYVPEVLEVCQVEY